MQGSNGAASWSRCHLAPSLKKIGLHISRTRGGLGTGSDVGLCGWVLSSSPPHLPSPH